MLENFRAPRKVHRGPLAGLELPGTNKKLFCTRERARLFSVRSSSSRFLTVTKKTRSFIATRYFYILNYVHVYIPEEKYSIITSHESNFPDKSLKLQQLTNIKFVEDSFADNCGKSATS